MRWSDFSDFSDCSDCSDCSDFSDVSGTTAPVARVPCGRWRISPRGWRRAPSIAHIGYRPGPASGPNRLGKRGPERGGDGCPVPISWEAGPAGSLRGSFG